MGEGLRRRLRLAWIGGIATALLLVGAGVARAQSLNGGCTATVSGRTLPTMTFDDPLVVTKGKRVRVNASVPASGRAARTNLAVKVGPVSNSYSFKGSRYNRSLTPPSWLFTIADGTVRFSGSASGNGYECTGSGFVKIDGDGLLSLIGGTLLGAGGAAGVAGASGPKEPPTADDVAKRSKNELGREVVNIIKELGRELSLEYGASLGMLIALLLITLLLVGPFGWSM